MYDLPASSHLIESRSAPDEDDYDYYKDYYADLEIQNTTMDSKDTDVHKMHGLPSTVYCDLVESMRTTCGIYTVLELWNFDEGVIANLTKEQIVSDVNNVKFRYDFLIRVRKDFQRNFLPLSKTPVYNSLLSHPPLQSGSILSILPWGLYGAHAHITLLSHD